MSSVKRILAIERLSDIQLNTINKKPPLIAFYSNWKGKVAMLPSVRIQVHPKQLSCNFIGQLSLHHLYRKGQIERTPDKAATVWREQKTDSNTVACDDVMSIVLGCLSP